MGTQLVSPSTLLVPDIAIELLYNYICIQYFWWQRSLKNDSIQHLFSLSLKKTLHKHRTMNSTSLNLT